MFAIFVYFSNIYFLIYYINILKQIDLSFLCLIKNGETKKDYLVICHVFCLANTLPDGDLFLVQFKIRYTIVYLLSYRIKIIIFLSGRQRTASVRDSSWRQVGTVPGWSCQRSSHSGTEPGQGNHLQLW